MRPLKENFRTAFLHFFVLFATPVAAQTTPHEWMRDWLLCGPFPLQSQPNNTPDATHIPDFETDFLQAHGGEGNPHISVGQVETFIGGTAKWISHTAPDFAINLDKAVSDTAFAAAQRLFIFKVSLSKNVWRRISIPSSADLDDLSYAILDSVDFDNDHLYQFTYRNQMGRKVIVAHPACEEDLCTDEVFLSDLPLQVGESMEYLIDFGDCWEFNVQLESFEPGKPKRKKSVLLESHGEAPEQYPGWDEDDDEDDE